MKKKLFRLIVTLLFLVITNSSVNASSAFVSSISFLSVNPSILIKKDLIERALHQRQEAHCLALGLYHEARGETVLGQYAVGATILNRVRSTAYPSTVCRVVFQNQHKKFRCQFSFACDGISDMPKNTDSFIKMRRLAKLLISKGIDREAKFIGQNFHSSFNGMTHYHRYDVRPVWSKKLKQISVLGNHIFFQSHRVTKRYRH